MEAVRDAWTDDRLDDLNHRVDGGFKEMRDEFRTVRTEMHDEFRAVRTEMQDEFRAVRTEMRAEFGGVRGEITSVRGEITSVRGEITALHRTMIQLFGGLIGTLVVGFAGLIATQL